MRTSLKLIAAAVVAIIALNAPGVSAAGGGSETASPAPVTPPAAATTTPAAGDDFVFKTPAGGSLSLLVRRAVQLFDAGDQKISLNPAQAMYVEANVVQEMGSRELGVDEEVRVSRNMISTWATRSQALDQTSLGSWQTYAETIDQSAANAAAPVSQPAAPATPANTPGQDEDPEAQDESESDRDQQSDNRTSRNWWWLLALPLAAGLYYAYRPKRNSVEPAEVVKPAATAPKRKKTPAKKKK